MKYLSRIPFCVACNLLLAFLCYTICRVEFLLENWSIFQGSTTWASFVENCRGGLLFDASAIFYTNSLWLVLMLLPLRWLQKPTAQAILKWLFVVVNGFCVVINLMDSVYFPFTQQRTTAFVFDEFQNEGNLLTIFGVEVVRHWYLVLLAAVLIYALFKGYRKSEGATSQKATAFYLTQTLSLLLFAPIAVCGMRGASLFNSTRPIAISNAHQFAATPLQSGLVLNTPFAILRTLNEKPMQVPTFFETQAELDSIYTPVHVPDSNRIERRKNVVILIVESFAQEFVGALNHHLDNGTYRGYTPFADSLLAKSLTWQETISNSGFSIDAMPAVLASIPRMDKPFVLTPFSLYTLNRIQRIGPLGLLVGFLPWRAKRINGLSSLCPQHRFRELLRNDRVLSGQALWRQRGF